MPSLGFDGLGGGRMSLLRDPLMAESGLGYGRRYSDRRQPRRNDVRNNTRQMARDRRVINSHLVNRSLQTSKEETSASQAGDTEEKLTVDINENEIKEARSDDVDPQSESAIPADPNDTSQNFHFHSNPLVHEGLGPPPPYFTGEGLSPTAPPMDCLRGAQGGEHEDFLDHFGKISGCKATTNIIALMVAVVLFAIFVVVLVVLS